MRSRSLFLVICLSVLLCACGSGNAADQAETTVTAASVTGETLSETASVSETEAETEAQTESVTETETVTETSVSEHETAPVEKVGYEGMEPIYADSLKDGEYDISVDSSSSMFKINSCKLTVSGGKMTAVLAMGGTGYKYLFMGTGEEASAASEGDLIPYEEDAGGTHRFTVPVEALDAEIPCAAFSTKKEEWYDRLLVFRADSLPVEAFADGVYNTVESLGLMDGEYTIEVALDGGSGKASVQSPAVIMIEKGKASAHIIWSSNKYDYMIVGGNKILPTSVEEYSEFDIPLSIFDHRMPVSADTTAMSVPYEIDYTLTFDSSTITGISP